MSEQRSAFVCGYCLQVGYEGPPHHEDPCPLKVKVDEAYIAMLDAQRMSYLRTPGAMEDMGKAMQRMAGQEDE